MAQQHNRQSQQTSTLARAHAHGRQTQHAQHTPHTKQTIAPHKLTPTMQQPQHSTAPRDAASHAHVRLPHTAQPRHHTDAAQQTSRQCTKRAKHSAAKPSEANRKRKLAFDGDIIDLLALADASAQFEQQLQDIETATSISIMYVC